MPWVGWEEAPKRLGKADWGWLCPQSLTSPLGSTSTATLFLAPLPFARSKMSLVGEVEGAVWDTAPGSLRPTSSSVQQPFCNKSGAEPDVARSKRRHEDNRFDTSEVQHGLYSQHSAYSVVAAVSDCSAAGCSYRNCRKQ